VNALVLSELTVRAGTRLLLDRVTLSLEPGEILALVGPNGAGKTTLLRAALGLVRITSGDVRLQGKSLTELTPRERARELGWLPQEPLRAEPVPALEAVTAARYRFTETAANARKAALGCLERVGMADRADQPLAELSGGERQRVAMAALLAQEARVLLLDEPANHLDPALQAETYALLGALLDAGTSVLCVTHDVNLLAHVRAVPRIAGLKAGVLVATTRYDAADLPATLEMLFGVPMQALEARGRRLIAPLPGALGQGEK